MGFVGRGGTEIFAKVCKLLQKGGEIEMVG